MTPGSTSALFSDEVTRYAAGPDPTVSCAFTAALRVCMPPKATSKTVVSAVIRPFSPEAVAASWRRYVPGLTCTVVARNPAAAVLMASVTVVNFPSPRSTFTALALPARRPPESVALIDPATGAARLTTLPDDRSVMVVDWAPTVTIASVPEVAAPLTMSPREASADPPVMASCAALPSLVVANSRRPSLVKPARSDPPEAAVTMSVRAERE